MWSEEPSIAKVLFNTKQITKNINLPQGMWSEEPIMTNILFNIQTSNQEY